MQMSTKKARPASRKVYDNRSFIELWYSLPEAGQQMLSIKLKENGISPATRFKWQCGSVPRNSTIKTLSKVLLKCFGIYTLPYTLFPDRETRMRLAEQCRERRERDEWDGVPDWPSLRDEEEQTTN